MTPPADLEACVPHRRPDARFLIAALAVGAAVSAALALALWPPAAEAGKKGDVALVARGQEVEVADHLVAGKYTLIDFYAEWCPNCRKLNPLLETLARRQPQLAIRKVDILSFDSPVARQYGIGELPHLLLFDPEGRMIAEQSAVLEALQRIFS